MQALAKKRVVVLGGYGEFSRRVAAGIAALPQVECVLGLPPPAADATRLAQSIGVPFMMLDPNDPASLFRLLEGAFAVVNVRGPFTGRDHLTIPAHCAALGVHYIDPADTREYVEDFTRLTREAREHDALLVTGAGTAPAVTSALTEWLIEGFERVDEIHIFVTPGMGDRREIATARSIVGQVAAPLPVKESGRWREEHSWTRPITIRFPSPIGRRRGYLCDLPDLELFAKRFDARTITARAGFAPGALNMTLATLAAMRVRGWVKRLSPMPTLLVRLAAHLIYVGAKASALRVAVTGVRDSVKEEHVAYLIARNDAGTALSAAPILALVRRWVQEGVKQTGAVPCVGMLGFNDLKPEMAPYDIVLVRH